MLKQQTLITIYRLPTKENKLSFRLQETNRSLPFPFTVSSAFRTYEVCSEQGCGAGTGTGTGRNRIHLGTSEPEPYSEFGSGSEYKEMKQTTQKKKTQVQ